MTATDIRQTIEQYQLWRQLIYVKWFEHYQPWRQLIYVQTIERIPTMTVTDGTFKPLNIYQPWRHGWYTFKPLNIYQTMTATDIRQTIEHYQSWRQLIYVKPLNTTHQLPDGWYTFKPLNITIQLTATDKRQTMEHYQPWRQLIYVKPLNIYQLWRQLIYVKPLNNTNHDGMVDIRSNHWTYTNHDGNWYTSNHLTLPTMTATDIRQTIEHYQPWRQLIYVQTIKHIPTMAATDW